MTQLDFPQLIRRMIQQESSGNPNAVSPVGASGLMQIMPGTAADPGFGVTPLPWDQVFDPAANQNFGEDYMQALLGRYGNDQARSLVAYNWGAGNADDWDGNVANLPEETRGYLSAILGGSPAGPAAQPAAQFQASAPGVGQIDVDALQALLSGPTGAPVTSPRPAPRAVAQPEPMRTARPDLTALLAEMAEASDRFTLPQTPRRF
jgi:hypothetical protein